QRGQQVLDYRINIAYKVNHPEQMHIRVEGLDAARYSLQKDMIQFQQSGRQDVALRIHDGLPEGLYRFRVVVTSDGGWSRVFKLVHFATPQHQSAS
ncbi:MAG: 4Fe-4S binding protein, partial [Mariprofundaceae bacterium]|nr:4Fe-4S binding protein [Mariprofundaceae bacterium]